MSLLRCGFPLTPPPLSLGGPLPGGARRSSALRRIPASPRRGEGGPKGRMRGRQVQKRFCLKLVIAVGRRALPPHQLSFTASIVTFVDVLAT